MRKLLSVLSSTLRGGVREGLLFLLLIANVSAIYASDTQVDGIWYDFDSSTKTASVTYRGSGFNSYSNEYSGSVVIPKTVTYDGTTYSVTRIGYAAFYGCSSLTSVTIGESVTSIRDYAFDGCSSLTSVTIPNSVTSIGIYAFSGCSSLTSVTIPNSVTSIEAGAFFDCSSLTKTNYTGDIAGWCNIKFEYFDANPMCYSHNFYINDQEIKDLVIPESVTSIGDLAFSECSSLTSVTIGESVTSIGAGAFYNCESLTSVTIPNNVTIIGGSAFQDCSSLTSVTIGESVTSIGGSAFYNCESLTSVTIGESVTSIGDYAFADCDSLTSVTIGESVTSIGDYAFAYCPLTSVTIPNNVTIIGGSAFKDCSSLTSVTIGESVTSIGDKAFYGCFSLTKNNYTGDIAGWCNIKFGNWNANPMYYSHNFYINDQEIKNLVIPESVTSIGDYAFLSCSSLTSVTIGESVTSIGDYAFDGCSSLTSATIGESVTSIGYDAFYGCSSLTSVTINSDAIVRKAYSDKTGISNIFGSQVTEYIIGESVTSIGEAAFSGCSSLTSLTIPNSVNSIKDYAFYGCSSLTSVTLTANSVEEFCYGTGNSLLLEGGLSCDRKIQIDGTDVVEITIPNSVTRIRDNAFYNCSSLTSVTIGNGVTSIGENAFSYCSSLTSVTIGESVTSIGIYAFNKCSSLTKTNYTGDIAGWCNIKFGNYSANPMYYSHNFYINDQEIKDLVIPNSVTSIEYRAFAYCSSLTSVTIPNSVTSIGDYAFYNCEKLGTLVLGDKVKEIGEEAFNGCNKLYHIYCYAPEPPMAYESSFANYNVNLYVPCNYLDNYKYDRVFGSFRYIQCIDSEDVATNDVVVTPGTNDVTITWPTEDNANNYTIVIEKDGEVFCTLTFNADGQLLNIAFAPGRDGNHPAQYAEQAGNGYRFTVTGLEEGTQYAYNITTKDAANKTIATYSGEFTTMGGTTTDMDNIQSPMSNCQKLLRDNQLYIYHNGSAYTIMGQKVSENF